MSGMSFDSLDGSIWYNGDLVDWKEAKIHVLNHGLHYGSSVFEGIRIYDGNVFKLEEHNERLIESARILGFTIPYSLEEMNAATLLVLEKNNITNGYIRPFAWRGSEMMAISAQNTKIHFAIAAWEWPSYFDPEARMKGLRLDHAVYRRPDPATIPSHAKAAGLYMICTLSKHAAESKGYHDAMMLDWRGQVAEATGANIFFVTKEGEIHTPIPDCFLDGITRRTVIGLAKDRGMTVVERVIMPEELGDFEECFLTGTAAEVTPVSVIGDNSYTPGTVCKQLIDDYTALVHNQPREGL